MIYPQQNLPFPPFFGSFWPLLPLFLHFPAGHIPGEGCSYSLVTSLIPHCIRNADGELDSLKIANLAIFATLGPFFSPFTPILQPPTVQGKIPMIVWARTWSIRATEWPPASVIPAKLPDWWPIWQFFLLFGNFNPFFPTYPHFPATNSFGEGSNSIIGTHFFHPCFRMTSRKWYSCKIARLMASLAIFCTFWSFFPIFSKSMRLSHFFWYNPLHSVFLPMFMSINPKKNRFF